MIKLKEYIINGIKLDKDQIKVITSRKKRILVLAGAGSGKTLTIVAKVRYLIENLKVKKEDILCISFTNDSVNKLKEDLGIKEVSVMTFHKLALKIIGNKKEILTEDMLSHIIIDSFSNDTLFGLYEMGKDELYGLIKTFINLFKSKKYKLDKFYEFITKADYKDKMLLKEIMKCYICYEAYLNKENLIDFNDIINLAIEKLDNSSIRYKYVIIDEYQDTSLTKFKLIDKLVKLSNGNLFVVGDDFQSIYRFTGSDLNIITKFKTFYPFAKIFKLKNTYRTPNELIKISGNFIMKNFIQIRKKLKSSNHLTNSIQIVYYDNLNEEIKKVVKEDNIDNLFIIARDNKTLEKINELYINYKKLTVHKSKGLQEDYVFIINLNNNKNGFPNKYIDHKILKYVNNYKEYYPFEEERRLFYVALTRCKKRVYLFAPKTNPSVFVKEISKYKNVLVRKERS